MVSKTSYTGRDLIRKVLVKNKRKGSSSLKNFLKYASE